MLERYLEFRRCIDNTHGINNYLRSRAMYNLWKFIEASNPSGASTNYHSNEHMVKVWSIANWLADENRIKLDLNTQLACLMHDFDHTLGKKSDDINIIRACNGVDKLFVDYSEAQRNKIKAVIRKTRFPFLPENDPVTLDEACVRDADLLYATTEEHERYSILNRLMIEMHGDNIPELSIALDQQLEFWKSCTMFTEQGRRILRYFTDPIYTQAQTEADI